MKIQKLDHIGIRVSDFARSIAFYQQFGFARSREDLNERVVELRHPSGITLNLLDSANDNHGNNNVLMDVEQKYPGYTHMALNVASIDDAVTSINGAGLSITEGPVTFGNGNQSLFIRDPDLNVVEFTQTPV